ncbi:MAG: sulfate/molybdate ABC transporter ATP-binding protein [Actinomycetota bacterium]
MSLEAELRLTRGTLELDAAIEARAGETVALVGRNGAGKTTLLLALAGLVELERGRVMLDDEVLDDSSAGVHVPTEKRRVGLLFQDYLLFQHMSIVENVAFGLTVKDMSKREARSVAHGWLERMELASYADRRPSSLSGGQAQRVALARALAADPKLLLLDEPLAAIDAMARAPLRRSLIAHLSRFEGSRMVVTHDPVEAVLLGDRMVVLEDGRVIQSGSADELRRRPRSPYVAELFGLNLWRGRSREGLVTLESGIELIVPEAPAGEVLVSVSPRAVALHGAQPGGSPRNTWQGVVASVEPDHDVVRVRLEGVVPVTALVTAAAASELGLVEGARAWAAIKATEIVAYPA